MVVKVRLFRTYLSAFMTRHCGLILPLVHLTYFPLAILNVSSVFFGYPKYSSVTKVLFDLGLPSFSTLIHNSKVSSASRLSVCDNNIIRRVSWVCFVSLCLSLFVCSFFCICCMFYVYICLWTSVVWNKWVNEWMNNMCTYAAFHIAV